ncbi:phospholipid-binding lipoprotein MlaA [Pseudoxanthomonas sp. GM95]|uniref:MlaA family lipoprotein n=1 Tax=Pseudoxanthomonas sp. GM95 TaxID=1881043 RepID=UPI0008C5A182|nr:VacJ family lipoprotein [Pseudoxanthomonas sp. GM95]SEM22163.1 phospholipid-binding lipoprotein MlaA [Pseudoxanthomonas sp. GM95]
MKTLHLAPLLLSSALLAACASNKPADTAPQVASTVIAPPATAAEAAPAADPAQAAAPATQAPEGAPPTAAEQDFSAIYNPVADPTLPPPAEGAPPSYDPWEKWNRKVHAFNNVVDRGVAKPLATAYVKVVPRPVRNGVHNFFDNLGQPLTVVNSLLQGKPGEAWDAFGRFLINTTAGVGGVFDVATRDQVPNTSEDFGQTLGVWGWRQSRYVELPLFGPRTVRDTFGLVGDAPFSPVQRIENDKVRIFTQGLQLVDVRTQLMAIDSMREGALDEYALFRDGWLQRRNYQISDEGERNRRKGKASDDLPAYLRDEDDNPTVPMDAMPTPNMFPGGG